MYYLVDVIKTWSRKYAWFPTRIENRWTDPKIEW